MVKFPSEEWFKALADEINKNKAYEEAAKKWEGSFIFIVTPSEGLEREYVFYMDLWHGKCRDVRELGSRDEVKADYVYEGSYTVWKSVIKGELDPLRAVLFKKLKLKGDFIKLMRFRKAVSEFMKTVQKIPTEFL